MHATMSKLGTFPAGQAKHTLKLRSKPIMGSHSNEPSVSIIKHYLSVTYSPMETKNQTKLLSSNTLASHWAGEQVAGFTYVYAARARLH